MKENLNLKEYVNNIKANPLITPVYKKNFLENINELIEELNLAPINNSNLYQYNEKGEVSLKQIHPELQKKMDALVEKCKEKNIEIRIVESLRNIERQDELYNQGRTTKGNIVTNAKGADYESMHQWGIAFDVCINVKGYEYNEELLKEVGEIGKSLGLEWGGDWEFKDTPHFQLPGYSEIEDLKEQYQNPANFADTWQLTNSSETIKN